MNAGVAAALDATLAALSARFAAAPPRDPWWVIGSAAAVLAGVDGFAPHDVDVLLSARDADAFVESQRDTRDTAYVPDDDARFRSRFARFRFAPMPVEVMGGLEVFRHGAWQAVEIAEGSRVACAGGGIPVPSLREQLRLFEWFGRDKDLAKAQRVRAHLARGEMHAA